MNFCLALGPIIFLQNALVTALAIGLVAGALGPFIILRSLSLMGDAISHAVLPGVALSYMLGINFSLGQLLAGYWRLSLSPSSKKIVSLKGMQQSVLLFPPF